MPDFIDQTAPVRENETLDRRALESFLRDSIPGLDGDFCIEQFPGGHSNLTYLVRFGGREFVVRRPPHGTQVKSAHDMGREYTMLSHLHSVYSPAPRPLIQCDDTALLGAPFYVMERIKGVIFRVRKPEGLKLSKAQVTENHVAFIDALADLHGIDYAQAGCEEIYRGAGYVERQVSGWSRRWANARLEELPAMTRVQSWLEENLTADAGATIIHNDFKYDNIVFDAASMTKVVGVLDWEMATVGDPLSDLATTLLAWTTERNDPSSTVAQSFMVGMPGALTRHEMLARYRERTGRDTANLLYYYVFALFKGAVMIQQIYHRYAKGLTTDARFATMNQVVDSLAARAAATIEGGDLE